MLAAKSRAFIFRKVRQEVVDEIRRPCLDRYGGDRGRQQIALAAHDAVKGAYRCHSLGVCNGTCSSPDGRRRVRLYRGLDEWHSTSDVGGGDRCHCLKLSIIKLIRTTRELDPGGKSRRTSQIHCFPKWVCRFADESEHILVVASGAPGP